VEKNVCNSSSYIVLETQGDWIRTGSLNAAGRYYVTLNLGDNLRLTMNKVYAKELYKRTKYEC